MSNPASRSREEIDIAVLSAIFELGGVQQRGVIVSHIAQKSRLSYKHCSRVLDELEYHDYITQEKPNPRLIGDNRVTHLYKLKESGLARIRQLQAQLLMIIKPSTIRHI